MQADDKERNVSLGDRDWHHLITLLNEGRISELLARAKPLVKTNPKIGPLQSLYGTALARTGRLDEAEIFLQRGIRLAPQVPFAHVNLANVYFSKGRFVDAIDHYRSFLKLEPGNVRVILKLGESMILSGKPADARDLIEGIISADDRNAAAWFLLGIAQRKMQDNDAALRCFMKTAEIAPKHVTAIFNIGNIYRDQGEADTAMRYFRDALSLRPDHLPTMMNVAHCQIDLHDLDAALETIDEAIELEPDNPEPRFVRSIPLFLAGKIKQGFEAAEWRQKLPREYKKLYTGPEPEWDGDAPLTGKSLVVYAEQGFGDTLMMLRFLEFLPSRDCRITVLVQRGLGALVARNYPDFNILEISEGLTAAAQGWTGADFQCSLMSLAHLTRSRWNTPPCPPSYIRPIEACVREWKKKTTRRGSRTIGIAWRGNPNHRNDHNRSISLATFLKHLSPAHHYVLLQKDPFPEELALISDHKSLSVQYEKIDSFDDTASLITALDHVLTVDTSVAHLAGALGASGYVLIPSNPDWRWGLGGDRTIWYPHIRLVRQTEAARWDEPVERAINLMDANDKHVRGA